MNPPKLKEIVVWIAQLGGFLNRKSDNNPGVKTIWIGIQRMRDFALLWETVNSKIILVYKHMAYRRSRKDA